MSRERQCDVVVVDDDDCAHEEPIEVLRAMCQACGSQPARPPHVTCCRACAIGLKCHCAGDAVGSGPWICSACTFENNSSGNECEVCGNPLEVRSRQTTASSTRRTEAPSSGSESDSTSASGRAKIKSTEVAKIQAINSSTSAAATSSSSSSSSGGSIAGSSDVGIFVDTNAGEDGVYAALQSQGANPIKRRLDLGDIVVRQSSGLELIFERKSWVNYISLDRVNCSPHFFLCV